MLMPGTPWLLTTLLFCGVMAALELKIGYINNRLHNHRGPAVTFGIKKFLEKHPQYEGEINITMTNYLSVCSPVNGTAAVIKAVEEDKVDVLIGLMCSEVCEPTGYYLNYYNMGSFAGGCVSSLVNNKTTFPTIVRTFPSTNRLGIAVAEVCRHYNWTHVVVYTSDYRCHFSLDTMKIALRAINVSISDISIVPMEVPNEDIRQFLTHAKERGQIYFVCLLADTILRFMKIAHELGMTGSDFVYIYYYITPSIISLEPWRINITEETPLEVIQFQKEIFTSLRAVIVADISMAYTEQKNNDYEQLFKEEPWNVIGPPPEIGSDYMAVFTEDAAYLYMMALTSLMENNQDVRNGRLLFGASRNRSFDGASGHVLMDNNADRVPDYEIHRYDPVKGQNIPYARIEMSRPIAERFIVIAPEMWGTADGLAPPDTPRCGFYNELCPPVLSASNIAITCVALLVVMATVVGVVLLIRQRSLEAKLLQVIWRVDYSDLQIMKVGRGFSSRATSSAFIGGKSDTISMTTTHGDHVTEVGTYKLQSVQIIKVSKQTVTLDKSDMMEMKMMRQMTHENINCFVGACVDPGNVCLLFNHCSKGSLQDILENDDIKLDWMFKMSLIQDLVNGLAHLHSSFVQSHGNLTSANCLVDSRWVLKITGFGLQVFRTATGEQDEYAYYRDMLWTAPELLRLPVQQRPAYGSQKGDVYSFAIVLQEIIHRALPYFVGTLSPKEVVKKIVEGSFRPQIPDGGGDHQSEIDAKMTECWSENPEQRPTSNGLKKFLRKLNKGCKTNIMDTMLAKLEKYASNLEDVVSQRTSELMDEKRKTDSLLYRMLPRVVAEDLKSGHSADAELFEQVTVYFSDIVDFTTLCSVSTPMQVVQLLNDLYTRFDGVIETHDVYKVETIGDAYMLVSGLPHQNKHHVAEVAEASLRLQAAVLDFRFRHLPDSRIRLRIGIHTGPCAAGVVGQTMPRYCLFGDTVNMASRMESTGEAFKIHMSESSAKALEAYPAYIVEKRGEIEVKGKGRLTTYWLLSKDKE